MDRDHVPHRIRRRQRRGKSQNQGVATAGRNFQDQRPEDVISCGMHDLTENIIHMVLARIDGAPVGVRGISIFLVPRLRSSESGELVDNDVACAGIEHKMGINGSATCVLNFGENGGCTGYLMGEENKGMKIMFDMMNEARLFVGMQGLGHAASAYLHALQYARERVQGPPIEKLRDPGASRVPIIQHPDVRRMLMFMKSSTEGMRALLYLTAYCVDRVRTAGTGGRKGTFPGYVTDDPNLQIRGKRFGIQGVRDGRPGLRRLRIHPGIPGRTVHAGLQDRIDL